MIYDAWEQIALRAALKALGRRARNAPEGRFEAYDALSDHLRLAGLHPDLENGGGR